MSAATPSKPAVLAMDAEGVPAELRELDAWVGWKLTRAGERWTKVPIDLKTGGLAASDDPASHLGIV